MDTATFKFKFGDEVVDRINGFAGVVVARDQWDTGCKRYAVKPRELKAGEPVKSQWIEEEYLDLKTASNDAPPAAAIGGPQARRG